MNPIYVFFSINERAECLLHVPYSERLNVQRDFCTLGAKECLNVQDAFCTSELLMALGSAGCIRYVRGANLRKDSNAVQKLDPVYVKLPFM